MEDIESANAERLKLARLCNGWSKIIETSLELPAFESFTGPLNLCLARATDGQQQVVWQSQTVAKDRGPESPYSFTWLAGTGYKVEPDCYFTLYINDRVLLNFSMTHESKTWKSEDGQANLKYDVKAHNDQDSSGIMTLTLSPKLALEVLKAGKTVEFKVVSSKSNSNRWFGIYKLW